MSTVEALAVAIIPARGGSKGVPGKNLLSVGGVSLVGRAVRAALSAGIEKVYVSTDHPDIAAEARALGAAIVDRPADIAGDEASSESALLHALDAIEEDGVRPTVLAFIQATSPFVDSEALRSAVARVKRGEEDVVFAARETYSFFWRRGDAGAEAINHDATFRPRRQDREPHFEESGAFYVMNVNGFRQARFRFFGNVGIQEVPPATAIEIDTPVELDVARAVAHLFDRPEPIDVDAVVMDFDGVHTDDTATVDQDGREAVTVSRSDGMGMEMLRREGLALLILSKERNPVVSARAAKLGVEAVQATDDKESALRDWCMRNRISPARVAYVGNDINDEACLRAVGWPVVVRDSPPSVLALARIALTRPGGRGAVRELADLIIAARRQNNL